MEPSEASSLPAGEFGDAPSGSTAGPPNGGTNGTALRTGPHTLRGLPPGPRRGDPRRSDSGLRRLRSAPPAAGSAPAGARAEGHAEAARPATPAAEGAAPPARPASPEAPRGDNGAATTRRILRPASAVGGAAPAAPASRAPRPAAAAKSSPVWVSRARARTGFLARPLGKAVVGGAAAVLLAGGIGTALWLRADRVDPQKVKAGLRAELDRINAIAADQVIEKDDQLHLIVYDDTNEKYGGEVYREIARAHETLHGQAEASRKARQKAAPFLDRWKGLKSDRSRLDKEAPRLLDECRSLREQFAATSFGPALDEAGRELEAFLASRSDTSWEGDFLLLRKQADAAAASGDFSGALDRLREFGAKNKEGEKLELAAKLSDLRAALRKKGEARIDALLAQARKLSDDGRGEEARTLVKAARPGFGGIPRARDLDAFLGKE